jgi:hypothetical protein
MPPAASVSLGRGNPNGRVCVFYGWRRRWSGPRPGAGGAPARRCVMPIILWLLGVPLSLIIILFLLGVF